MYKYITPIILTLNQTKIRTLSMYEYILNRSINFFEKYECKCVVLNICACAEYVYKDHHTAIRSLFTGGLYLQIYLGRTKLIIGKLKVSLL